MHNVAMHTLPRSTSFATRVWRGFLLLVVIAVLVVHAAAGWTFASRIVEDGFTRRIVADRSAPPLMCDEIRHGPFETLFN